MKSKIKIALFGSFYRGFYLLDELLQGASKDLFHVVGVATDDAQETFISSHKRVWQYPHSPLEETMVEQLAHEFGIEVYKGRVKNEDFYIRYEENWTPDFSISATFGQRIDQRLFSYPKMGFFNLHPCIEDGWPSKYAGPNPFKALMEDGHTYTTAALHRVDDGFDTGELMAMSERIAIPPGASVVDMHKISSPVIAKFAISEIIKLARMTAR
jgi:methionyl-tRNA formyltransferase